jgi:hypothetical protein
MTGLVPGNAGPVILSRSGHNPVGKDGNMKSREYCNTCLRGEKCKLKEAYLHSCDIIFEKSGKYDSTKCPTWQPNRFIDFLKSTHDIDCDLIIGDCDMPASFVWYNDGDVVITEAGYQKFKSLMDSPYEILKNGNIEIFCDDDALGEKFVYAAAGYISDSDYKLYFEGAWCKC